MASTRKRGNSWYVYWTDPFTSKRQKKSCGSGVDAEFIANRLARRIEAEILLGKYKAKPKKVAWEVFLKEYRERVIDAYSLENAEACLGAIKRFTDKIKPGFLNSITTKDIETFVEARKKEPGKDREFLSHSTINKDIRYLKALFETAKEWEYIKTTPRFQKLKELKREPTFVSQEEFSLIYKNCPDKWWRGFLLFQFMTGWRLSQVLKLNWDTVDLDNKELLSHAEDNKGKRDVLLPIHDVLAAELGKLKRKQGQPVFPFRGDLKKLYYRFQKIQQKAGITPRNKLPNRWYTFHDLRRGFATLNAENLDPFELQKLMQHKNIQTTMKYVAMAHRMKDAVERVQAPKLD